MPKKLNKIEKKEIAPRLASGERREHNTHGLPPVIKEGLRAIARKENKSLSWILETVVLEYFGFKTPKYIEKKKK